MNVLLDTHTIIWAISNDNQLTNQSRNIIEDTSNNCFVSMASLWEMGIKVSGTTTNLVERLIGSTTNLAGNKHPNGYLSSASRRTWWIFILLPTDESVGY